MAIQEKDYINSIYKIISKAFYNQLKKILPSLISHHQNGFTPGREISSNIIYVSSNIIYVSKVFH